MERYAQTHIVAVDQISLLVKIFGEFWLNKQRLRNKRLDIAYVISVPLLYNVRPVHTIIIHSGIGKEIRSALYHDRFIRGNDCVFYAERGINPHIVSRIVVKHIVPDYCRKIHSFLAPPGLDFIALCIAEIVCNRGITLIIFPVGKIAVETLFA